MATIKLIRRRIKSASNISQITRAMEMVAASKMKRAQEAANSGKPYAQKIYQAVAELGAHAKEKSHPLLMQTNPTGKKLIILISTNKGLCGGLNTNLFRSLTPLIHKEKTNIEFVSVGKKGEAFVVRAGSYLVADFSHLPAFTESVVSITKFAIEGFVKGTYGQVYVVYNNFISALKQIPTMKRILPIGNFEGPQDTVVETRTHFTTEFLFEPSREEILNSLLPHYLENQIRSAILEAQAAEHSARMIAMKNATDAALDLVDALTLSYNKARQEKITYEIADIVTAREAVK